MKHFFHPSFPFTPLLLFNLATLLIIPWQSTTGNPDKWHTFFSHSSFLRAFSRTVSRIELNRNASTGASLFWMFQYICSILKGLCSFLSAFAMTFKTSILTFKALNDMLHLLNWYSVSLYFQQFTMLKFSSMLYLAPVISQCQLFPFNAMIPQWHARFQKCYDGVKNAQRSELCTTLSIPISDL